MKQPLGVHHEFMGRWVAPLRQPLPSPGLSLLPVKSEQSPPFPKGCFQLRGGPALKHPVVRSKSPALRERGSLDARLSAPTPKPPGRPEPAGVASRASGAPPGAAARARAAGARAPHTGAGSRTTRSRAPPGRPARWPADSPVSHAEALLAEARLGWPVRAADRGPGRLFELNSREN